MSNDNASWLGGLLLLLSVTVECCRYIILFALHVCFPYYKFYFCLRLQFELEIGIENLWLQWLHTVHNAHIAYKRLLVSLKHFDWIPWNSFQSDELHWKFYIKNSDLNYGIFSIYSWFTRLIPVWTVWWWMEKRTERKKPFSFILMRNVRKSFLLVLELKGKLPPRSST